MSVPRESLVSCIMVTGEKLIVDLADGRSLIVPLERYPQLLHGRRLSARTGNCWGMATRSNGLISMNTSAWKVFWRVAGARATTRFSAG